MFDYAVQVSLDAGFDGVLSFKAKTSELLDYYAREFGARRTSTYDPSRMVIWEDAAECVILGFRRGSMADMTREEELRAEAIGGEQGWVAPLTQEGKEYFAYLRTVFKRYHIIPPKVTRLECDFVIRVAESKFYLQQANECG